MDERKKKRVQVWLDRSTYDLDTARAMFETGRHVYVLFMCQQAIEKKLKAYIENNAATPPRIHNLFRLAEMIEFDEPLSEENKDFLQELTVYYLDSRYKEDIKKLSEFIDKDKAQEYLIKTEKILQWFIQKMKY